MLAHLLRCRFAAALLIVHLLGRVIFEVCYTQVLLKSLYVAFHYVRQFTILSQHVNVCIAYWCPLFRAWFVCVVV